MTFAMGKRKKKKKQQKTPKRRLESFTNISEISMFAPTPCEELDSFTTGKRTNKLYKGSYF
jgi:hypothetical protein